jgi:hypothetical protein
MTSPARLYPRELAARVREAWPADAERLPASLETLLDTAYHASFLRDEERPVTCRILVAPASTIDAEGGPPTGLLRMGFAEPRPFDEHEIRRLSPAAKYHRALIGVDEHEGALVTWGIVQSGPRWLQAAHGGRAVEPPLPARLVIRVVRPGQILVHCGSRPVAELRNGKLTDFALDVFQSQWLPGRFVEERGQVVTEHRNLVDGTKIAEVAYDLTKHVAQQMLKRVVSTMRAAHHGGTIVIAPPACLADRHIRAKYEFRDEQPRRRFRALMQSILAVLAEQARDRSLATGPTAADTTMYLQATDPRVADLDEALFEMGHLIAALADVDGAVVLTKRFEILGFGAEIAGDLPPVTLVRRALDLEGETYIEETVDGVGTRHRSAYRLCAAVPTAIALVVSQDGGVRFVTRHRDAITYGDHGAGDD